MKFRISIIEPDMNARNVLNNVLKESGFEVFSYADGETALEKWKTVKPHLAIFEWSLKGYSSSKLCREINIHYPEMPFYILSDIRDMNVKLEALQAGALDFLTKPFDREMLLAKINTALRIYNSNSRDSKVNGSSDNKSKPSFVEYLITKKIKTIKPAPDGQSKFGFSYKLLSKWDNKELNPEQQIEFLEKLEKDGWLVKRIYDMVKTCPTCSSYQINIRTVCPDCHSPIFTQDIQFKNSESNSFNSGISHFNRCERCQSEFKHGLSFARCWSCETEFKEEEANAQIIYSFSLKPGIVPDKPDDNALQMILNENGLQTLDGCIFEDFLRLEKHQHHLAQKPYAVLHLRFSSMNQAENNSENKKKINHVVLMVKKLMQPQDAAFCKAPNELILFFSYTEPRVAETRAARINSYLDKLKLSSFVQLDLTTHNYSKVLDILEREIETV